MQQDKVNRWFEVTAERYDFMIDNNPRRMVSYPKGGPYYGTKACVEQGLAKGLIKNVPNPNKKEAEEAND